MSIITAKTTRRAFTAMALAAFATGLTAPVTSSTAEAAGKKGTFKSQGRYSVRGSVTVSENGTIRLSGFRTSSGPDLYVYVGNGSPSRRIAKLRANSGTQTYKISPALAKSISSVHIHCKRFSSTFGTARVK
ncbi:MAG: DM13 domain-containing protein [Pseudomonadota bacterium]